MCRFNLLRDENSARHTWHRTAAAVGAAEISATAATAAAATVAVAAAARTVAVAAAAVAGSTDVGARGDDSVPVVVVIAPGIAGL